MGALRYLFLERFQRYLSQTLKTKLFRLLPLIQVAALKQKPTKIVTFVYWSQSFDQIGNLFLEFGGQALPKPDEHGWLNVYHLSYAYFGTVGMCITVLTAVFLALIINKVTFEEKGTFMTNFRHKMGNFSRVWHQWGRRGGHDFRES